METKVEYKEITIKPITRAKFSGISGHSNTVTVKEGAQMGKSGYKTGLTRDEEVAFEEALNLPKGTLNSKNEAFWGNILNLRLPNDKSFQFTVSTLLDELKYRVLLQRSDIANNELEILKNPRAEFYIVDDESRAKVEEVEIDYLMSAHEDFANLTTDEKKGYLKLYGKRGVDNLSDRIIKTELFKELNKDPKRFVEFVKNPDIKLRIEIEDMLEAGTLLKKGSYYNFESEVIGNSIDSVISFFKDLKNQSVKIAAVNASKQKLKGK